MTASAPRQKCSRCGRRMLRDKLVFSHYSRRYFCSPLNWGDCQAIVVKKAKAEA